VRDANAAEKGVKTKKRNYHIKAERFELGKNGTQGRGRRPKGGNDSSTQKKKGECGKRIFSWGSQKVLTGRIKKKKKKKKKQENLWRVFVYRGEGRRPQNRCDRGGRLKRQGGANHHKQGKGGKLQQLAVLMENSRYWHLA